MIKIIFRTIALILSILAISYLLTSFTAWEYSISEWGFSGRLLFLAIYSIIFATFIKIGKTNE